MLIQERDLTKFFFPHFGLHNISGQHAQIPCCPLTPCFVPASKCPGKRLLRILALSLVRYFLLCFCNCCVLGLLEVQGGLKPDSSAAACMKGSMPHIFKTFTFVRYPNVIGSRKTLAHLSSGRQMESV